MYAVNQHNPSIKHQFSNEQGNNEAGKVKKKTITFFYNWFYFQNASESSIACI